MTISALFVVLTSYCIGTIIGCSLFMKDYPYTLLGTLALVGFILYLVVT